MTAVNAIALEPVASVPSDGIVLKGNPRGTYLIEVTLGSATGDLDQATRTDDRSEVA